MKFLCVPIAAWSAIGVAGLAWRSGEDIVYYICLPAVGLGLLLSIMIDVALGFESRTSENASHTSHVRGLSQMTCGLVALTWPLLSTTLLSAFGSTPAVAEILDSTGALVCGAICLYLYLCFWIQASPKPKPKRELIQPLPLPA